MSKANIAGDYFRQGYNCAQSVFAAFKDEMGLEEKLALRISSGFGGGIGGMRGICGAVSGMLMAWGALKGYDTPDDQEKKQKHYASTHALAENFEYLFGTMNCAELLAKHNIVTSFAPAERDEDYYLKRPCARYVEACAGLLEETLKENR